MTDTPVPANESKRKQMTSFHDLYASMMEDAEFREAYEDAEALATLRAHLVQIRHAMGLKQSLVAERMNVSQSTVSEFENSANDPRISTLQRYARAVCARLDFAVHLPVETAWTGKDVERWADQVTPRTHESLLLFAETKGGDGAVNAWRAAHSKRSDFAIAA